MAIFGRGAETPRKSHKPFSVKRLGAGHTIVIAEEQSASV